jgi:tubulin-specific chaperone E
MQLRAVNVGSMLTTLQIHTVCEYFRSLTSLIIPGNQLSHLELQPLELSFLDTITTLDIGSNLFTSLSELSPLCKLSNLQKLLINHGTIRQVSCESTIPSSFQFSRSVVRVELAFNEISSWEFVSQLNALFPGLRGLRISHNPLYQNLRAPDGRHLSADDGYMLTIGRLGHLNSLNYSPVCFGQTTSSQVGVLTAFQILSKDRLNADTYYLSQIVQELSLTLESDEDQVKDRHPRYDELCTEYGEPQIRRTRGSTHPDSLAASLINVIFVSANVSFPVQIPKRVSIYSVLGIVSRKVKVSPFELRLFWQTDDWIILKTSLGDEFEQWDSDDDEDETKGGQGRVRREVELLPGTRSLETWVDGKDVTIRVEVQKTTRV